MWPACLLLVSGLRLGPSTLAADAAAAPALAQTAPAYFRATGLNVTQEAGPAPLAKRGLVMLRIQKTATTSFGDRIMSRQCAANKLFCQVYWHLDWDLIASAPAYPNMAVVTFLRHPVERFASEYGYVRGVGADAQVQWDYSPSARQALKAGAPGAAPMDSLENFNSMDHNPAHNRMTRYILGFARPNIGCNGECGKNWDAFFARGGTDPSQQIEAALQTLPAAELLKAAKHRLSHSIQLLGITDCFDSSVVLLGTQLGWDVPSMLSDAAVHYRAGGANSTASSTPSHRATMPAGLAQAIEARNALDLELYLHAKRLVNARMKQLTPHVRCD